MCLNMEDVSSVHGCCVRTEKNHDFCFHCVDSQPFELCIVMESVEPVEETHGTSGQCVSFSSINAGSVLLPA